MLLFKRIEIWNRGRGSWLDFSNYQFGIDRCPAGCILLACGFWGITILRNECVKDEWFSIFDFDLSEMELTEDDLP